MCVWVLKKRLRVRRVVGSRKPTFNKHNNEVFRTVRKKTFKVAERNKYILRKSVVTEYNFLTLAPDVNTIL